MKKLMSYTESGARFFLALVMMMYGLVKIFATQFRNSIMEQWYDVPLGELTGGQIAWAFYFHSPAYEMFLGWCEFSCALLLLFRRTQLIGLGIFGAIVLNLFFLNAFYGIGVLPLVLVLMLMYVFLIIRKRRELVSAFRQLLLPTAGQLQKSRSILLGVKYVFVAGWLVLGLKFVYDSNHSTFRSHEITGRWKVLDAESEDPSGPAAWSNLYIERGNYFSSLASDSLVKGMQKIDEENDRIALYESEESYARDSPFFQGAYRLLDASNLEINAVAAGNAIRLLLRKY